MSLFSRSRLLVHLAIDRFPALIFWNVEVHIIPRRLFSALSIPRYQDKFHIGEKKRKSRKNSGSMRKPFWKQDEVFQLDRLTGQHAPDDPDTIKQHTVSDTLFGVIQEVLNCPELSPVLSPVIGNFQVEIVQVKISRNLKGADVFWTVPNELRGSEEKIQNLLDENRELIRRLLPAYSTLVRFPQLVFIPDKKADYVKEVQSLIQEAKNSDSQSNDTR